MLEDCECLDKQFCHLQFFNRCWFMDKDVCLWRYAYVHLADGQL
uniref:Uncharacterized protein n=1 Tax=Rhizophora mucronata TaxID=61149 RepID=A0A2P2QRZ0_RHIMU